MFSIPIFFLVILAALLHAIWNALAKHSQEREFFLGFVALGHAGLGLVIALWVPFPNTKMWGIILISTVVHYGYYFFLKHAYDRGDLSIVYPIARGLSPPLVTLGGFFFAGEVLSTITWMGILISSLGLILFAITGKKKTSAPLPVTLGLAVLTGFTIATYSVLDGLGGRMGDPLVYIAWLFIFELPVFLKPLFKNYQRLNRIPVRVYYRGILGGGIGALAYAIVIYAKSQTELGLVSTLRETSIVFAAMIAIIFLNERPWKTRLIVSGVVVGGLVILFFGY